MKTYLICDLNSFKTKAVKKGLEVPIYVYPTENNFRIENPFFKKVKGLKKIEVDQDLNLTEILFDENGDRYIFYNPNLENNIKLIWLNVKPKNNISVSGKKICFTKESQKNFVLIVCNTSLVQKVKQIHDNLFYFETNSGSKYIGLT